MVATDMQGFDRDLGQIEAAYRKAGILDQTLFVVTADHGMMPITHFVPSDLITNAITQAGTTAPDIATNSGDYVWLADPSKAQAVAQNIVNMHDAGIQEAYYLTTVNGKEGYLPADSSLDAGTEAANQYLLSALLNGHEPQVVVMGTEGASFSDPKSGWKADHGGASWESEHIPLVLAGPGIRAGVTSSAPAQLEDIAPTALTAMGVAPTGMEGHVLTDALTQPSQSAQRARRNEVTQITPDVQAMQRAESPSNVAGGS
jgi:arylsulfatase A-like enzyme